MVNNFFIQSLSNCESVEYLNFERYCFNIVQLKIIDLQILLNFERRHEVFPFPKLSI